MTTTPRITTYTYTIRTDAVLDEIEAISMDAAAIAFAAGEDLRGVTDTDGLLAAYARIGDGAWIWIESEHAPDGARRSEGC